MKGAFEKLRRNHTVVDTIDDETWAMLTPVEQHFLFTIDRFQMKRCTKEEFAEDLHNVRGIMYLHSRPKTDAPGGDTV